MCPLGAQERGAGREGGWGIVGGGLYGAIASDGDRWAGRARANEHKKGG